MKKHFNIFFVIIFLLSSYSLICCAKNDIATSYAYRDISFYDSKLDSELLKDRISIADQNIVNYLEDMDSTVNYSSYELNIQEIEVFEECVNILPKSYISILKEKVIGIYFIENYIYGGMTNYVFDKDGSMYMTLYFNPATLKANINEWIDYKEKTYFNGSNEDDYIESIVYNGIYPAFLFLLLHEASHIYDHYFNITPFVEPALANDTRLSSKDFVTDVWDDYSIPIEKYNFEDRDNLVAYLDNTFVDIDSAETIYRNLSNTPFASVYGSKIWAEDFAESFTWLYLYNNHNIYYIINIFKDGKLMYSFNQFNNDLFLKRYLLFDDIIKSNGVE